jgi:hypothetical protein
VFPWGNAEQVRSFLVRHASEGWHPGKPFEGVGFQLSLEWRQGRSVLDSAFP